MLKNISRRVLTLQDKFMDGEIEKCDYNKLKSRDRRPKKDSRFDIPENMQFPENGSRTEGMNRFLGFKFGIH